MEQTLSSNYLHVGFETDLPNAEPQNYAKMTIKYSVTVDVKHVAFVGGGNTGTLTLDGGGLNADGLAISGSNTKGTGDVFVKNSSKLNVRNALAVGTQEVTKNSDALLSVGLGEVITNDLLIGPVSNGSVIVRDGGTLMTTNLVNVGSSNAKGTLEVLMGGVVSVGGNYSNTTNGTTTLYSGSTLDLKAGGDNQGLFQEEKGGKLVARARGLINKGVIKVATAAGADNADIAVAGDFSQETDGHLQIVLAGNQAGVSHDRLRVSALPDEPGGGHATLDGHLDVTSSYTPVPWRIGGPGGDFFAVVSASHSLSGQFDPQAGLHLPDATSFMLPSLPPGHTYAWKVVYDTTDAYDPALADDDPAVTAQPWVGNGTFDVVLLLEEVALPESKAGM